MVAADGVHQLHIKITLLDISFVKTSITQQTIIFLSFFLSCFSFRDILYHSSDDDNDKCKFFRCDKDNKKTVLNPYSISILNNSIIKHYYSLRCFILNRDVIAESMGLIGKNCRIFELKL